jgi:hypothetical protein
MPRRSRDELERNRADLLAALEDATRPITAPALVAASHGYTLESIPDLVLHVAMHRGSSDLRALARQGKLAIDTPGFVATYTRVDLPGSELAEQQALNAAAREDVADLYAQVDGWELAE